MLHIENIEYICYNFNVHLMKGAFMKKILSTTLVMAVILATCGIASAATGYTRTGSVGGNSFSSGSRSGSSGTISKSSNNSKPKTPHTICKLNSNGQKSCYTVYD